MNGAGTYRLQEARNTGIVGVAAGLGSAMEHKVTHLRTEFKVQVPQQKIEHIHEAVHPLLEREKEHERYHENVMAEVVLQEPGGGRERLNSMVGGSGSSRSELLVEQHPPPRESRMERQLSTEQLIQARRDELPQEVWRERAERAERKLERQTSSELEGHEVRRRDRHRPERRDSSEQEAKEQSDRRSGGGWVTVFVITNKPHYKSYSITDIYWYVEILLKVNITFKLPHAGHYVSSQQAEVQINTDRFLRKRLGCSPHSLFMIQSIPDG